MAKYSRLALTRFHNMRLDQALTPSFLLFTGVHAAAGSGRHGQPQAAEEARGDAPRGPGCPLRERRDFP